MARQAFAETLRAPNLRRAQLSFGFAWSSEWALTVALGILAFRDGGATAVGVVAMARILPAALLAPAAAVVVDRARREQVLAGVGVVRGCALAAAAVVLEATGSPLPVYALAALATVVFTLYRPAHSALLPSLCRTPTQLAGANVVRGLQDSGGALVGPLAAGLLVGPTGVAGVLAACAAASLASGFLAARIRFEAAPRLQTPRGDAHPLREALGGFEVMRRMSDVRLLSLLTALQGFTRGCFAVFAVVVAIELLDIGESGVGLLTAAFGGGAVVGSIAVSLLIGSSGFARWFGVGVALWAAPFALLAPVQHELVAVVLLGLVGVANALVDATLFTTLNRLVPDDVMGRYFAGLEALIQVAVAAASLITPALIALLGTRGALVVVGVTGPLGVLLAWGALRRLDLQLRLGDRLMGLLREVEMFRPLPMATLASLAARARGDEAARGTVVVHEGETGDDFYVIARGRAEVLRGRENVCFLERGQCFGEIAALRASVRTSSVRAATDLRLVRLTGRDLVTAVTNYSPSQVAAEELLEQRLAPVG